MTLLPASPRAGDHQQHAAARLAEAYLDTRADIRAERRLSDERALSDAALDSLFRIALANATQDLS
jgi:hypothetical protein